MSENVKYLLKQIRWMQERGHICRAGQVCYVCTVIRAANPVRKEMREKA